MHQQSSEGQEGGAQRNRKGRGRPRKEDEEGWVLTWKGLWPHEEGITRPQYLPSKLPTHPVPGAHSGNQRQGTLSLQ